MATAPIVYLPSLIQIRPQWDPDPDTGNHPEQVLWFMSRSAGTPTVANLTTIGNTFDPLWGGMWSELGHTTQHYIGSIVSDFSSAFGLSISTVGAFTPRAGIQTTGLMPPNVAVLLSYKNGERFKGGHFRSYFPYVDQFCVGTDPSMVKTSVLTAMTSSFALVEPGMNGSGVLGGQTQRLFRHRFNPATARLDPITVFQFSPMFATQRRRLRKAPHR